MQIFSRQFNIALSLSKRFFSNFIIFLKPHIKPHLKLYLKPHNHFFYFFIILLIGTLVRIWGINQHWKAKDHINWGGPVNSHYTHCLNLVPLSISKGIPFQNCDTPDPLDDHKYTNHPTFLFLGLMVWTKFWGESEASFRSFTLIFSVLNIILIYALFLWIWPLQPLYALVGAFFQSFFLGGIYFGTHVDFPAEFTSSFILLASFFALKERWIWALLMTALAGFTDWPGFFLLPTFWIYSFFRKKLPRPLIYCTPFLCFFAYAIGAYLKSDWNLLNFLMERFNHKQYVKTDFISWSTLLFPLVWTKQLLSHLSRFSSPLFFSLSLSGLYALIKFKNSMDSSSSSSLNSSSGSALGSALGSPFRKAALLLGLPGLITYLIGYQYIYIHIFWLILWLPFLVLMATSVTAPLLQRLFQNTIPSLNDPSSCRDSCTNSFSKKDGNPWTPIKGFGFLALIFYPYGVYKTNLFHDFGNSLIFIITTLLFMKNSVRNSPAMVFSLLLISGLGNFSQVINYRNGADTEYEFCQKARIEYQKTNRSIETYEPQTEAKIFAYCRGIPIKFLPKPSISANP